VDLFFNKKVVLNNKTKWYFFENKVSNFLINKWFKILDKNFTIKWGEIDIIAEKNWIVHFVEVKWTTKNIDFQDYITKWKIKALEKTAKTWIMKNKSFDWYQFDLVLINNNKIELIENFLF